MTAGRELLRVFDRLVGAAARVSLWASAVILISIVSVVTAEIICRTFLATSLFVVEELVGYLLAAFAMFGLVHICRAGAILRVEVVYGRLSDVWRTRVDVVLGVFGLAYLLVLEYQLMRLVSTSHRREIVSVTLMSFPVWLPQALIAIAGFLLCAAVLNGIIRNLGRLATAPSSDGV